MGLKISIINSKKEDLLFCYNLTKENMQIYFEKNNRIIKEENFKKDFNIKEFKIITQENKKIGYYSLKENKDCFYLDNIQLIKNQIGKGIGTSVMEMIEKEVKKSKKPIIRLSVFKDNPALNFYKNLGYKIKEDKGDSILMEKDIFNN